MGSATDKPPVLDFKGLVDSIDSAKTVEAVIEAANKTLAAVTKLSNQPLPAKKQQKTTPQLRASAGSTIVAPQKAGAHLAISLKRAEEITFWVEFMKNRILVIERSNEVLGQAAEAILSALKAELKDFDVTNIELAEFAETIESHFQTLKALITTPSLAGETGTHALHRATYALRAELLLAYQEVLI